MHLSCGVKKVLNRHQFPANPLESRDSTFCIGTAQIVTIIAKD
jgi:hypothetical protein